VIRVSGRVPELRSNADRPRAGAARASSARRARSRDRDVIDEGLGAVVPGPNSETGEDIVELQVHGGRAVIAACWRRWDVRRLALGGGRRVYAPCFRERPHGLTAVEGLARPGRGRDRSAARQAFLHLKGLLGERAETWRSG
jgi:tRNA modification GTPase